MTPRLNTRQIIAMWVAIGLLAASWMFPPSPVLRYTGAMDANGANWHHFPGFRFFMEADCKPEMGKLLVIDLIIVTFTAGVIVTIQQKK